MTAIDAMEQLLESLHRRGAITGAHRESITTTDNVPAVVARLIKAGHVSEPVGRTILRTAKTKAKKARTYTDVINQHGRHLPTDGGNA